MELPIIENTWNNNHIKLQLEDGTILTLNKYQSCISGEIDKSHTHNNRYKKWNTFGGFNESTPYTIRLKNEYNLKDALWNFHFSYLGDENENLDLNNKLHSVSMAQMNLYQWLTDNMELPLPNEIQDINNMFIIEGNEIFIKAQPSQRDLLKVGCSDGGLFSFINKVIHSAHVNMNNFKNRLDIICPTKNVDGVPTVGEFINYYKELLFKAYTKWDFRYLYQPFINTGKFECPFKGRTPNIEEFSIILK